MSPKMLQNEICLNLSHRLTPTKELESDSPLTLSNVVMHTKAVILLANYSIGLNNSAYLSTMFYIDVS